MVISARKMTLKQIFQPFNPVREPAPVVPSHPVEPSDEQRYHLRFVHRGRFLRLFGGVALVVCACLLWLAPAALAGGSPSDSGVYDQYTEQVPSAGGSHGTGSGLGGSGGTGSPPGTSGGGAIVLPANLNAAAGKDAKTLREVATSPRFGAPSSTGQLPQGSGSTPAGFSAAVSTVTDGSDGRMVGLFVALLAVTAVSLGIAAARRNA
jgi:hypothetical protein